MKSLLRDNIKLEDDNHRYYLLDDPNIDLISCTTFIEYFFHKFDSIGIANNLTANHPAYIGMRPQELVASWEIVANEGTKIHNEIDRYIKYDETPSSTKSIQAIDWLKSIEKGKYEILSEIIIYSKEIKLAGTVDLIFCDKESKTINIYDWKTSKSMNTISYGSKMGRTQATSSLMDCNFIHYSLQLSLYRYIIEKYYGFKVSKLTLLHLNGSSVTPFECNYMEEVIEDMLKDDRIKLAKETEENLTKEYINELGFEPEDYFEPEPEDFFNPEDFEEPNPNDLM